MTSSKPNALPGHTVAETLELSDAFANIRVECEYRLNWTTLESCKPSRAQRVKFEKMKKLASRAIQFIWEDSREVLEAEGIYVRF